jgi:hypothetical protein
MEKRGSDRGGRFFFSIFFSSLERAFLLSDIHLIY